RGPRRGRGRRALAARTRAGARPGAVLAFAAHARDAGAGARTGRLRRPAAGGRHLRSLAGHPGRAGRPPQRGRTPAGGRPQPGAGAAGRAAAQRPVRRLSRDAAGRDRGAGAAGRGRDRTGDGHPLRVLVAVTGRGTAAAVVALLTLALLGLVHATQIDQEASRVGFTLKTRWGKTLVGHFPRHEGVITRMSGGMHQVRLRLSTADVEIEDSTTFTRLTRGDGFFDAARYPWVEFVSDPYPVSLIREGGRLGGVLTIRGVERRETFV